MEESGRCDLEITKAILRNWHLFRGIDDRDEVLCVNCYGVC